MNFSVTLFKNFKEDKRTSMDLYANYLEEYISKNYSKKIIFKSFEPKLLVSKHLPEYLKMRFARYIEYPFQVRSQKNFKNINHIVEDGYAHLINYPLINESTIVTVHDIIPLLAWNGFIENLSYPHYPLFAKYSYSFLKKAAHIITISENTKENLINYCGCDEDKISVIYYGCGSSFKQLSKIEKNQIRYNKFNFPKDCFLILITGHQKYKNHETALKVLAKFSNYKKKVYLVRLGRTDDEWDKLKRKYCMEKFIIEVGELDHKKVSELYNSVDCLLFPSWYEGFGRPPLEAMASGLPVVSSNVASLPEVIGNAGLLYEPDDVENIFLGLKSLIEDIGKRVKMIETGLSRASRFNWDNNIKQTVNLYKSVFKNINEK